MGDFRIVGEAMNHLNDSFAQVKEHMENSYQKVSQLLSQIESEKEWTGESADAFFLYVNLMSQYHYAFFCTGDYQPIGAAEEALKKLGENVDMFYADFYDYTEMEKIE